ncbi:peptidylprolyl isomerase [uncultured Roseovarius sp.]|uniref:peptidylprolyl isomerase n=1 Tax=uncultured Roseovarius sp. TaxID=293344 RepID=UPI00260FF675|nr:peptidylprolyl isomerase [uncultured Roseovarius sp.]
MSRNALAAVLLALGVAALAIFYATSRQGPEPVAEMPKVDTEEAPEEEAIASTDQPGPYLDIVIEGEASGTIRIDLNEVSAPGHTERMVALAESGSYDDVVFHRVIEGFMAQTGDVQFGKLGEDMRRAGTGGSAEPDLQAEFSDLPFDRGVVGMARSQNPDSANSQFFIMFAPGHFLNGQYTVVGQVTEGMEVVDAIKRGQGQNGAVVGNPDVMTSVTVAAE